MKYPRILLKSIIAVTLLFTQSLLAAPQRHPALSAKFDRDFLLSLLPLNDTATALKNKWASQKDIQGPMLAVFWHEWCAYCKLELEACQELKSKQSLTVIGISLDRDEKLARAWALPYRDIALFKNVRTGLKGEWQLNVVPFTIILNKSLAVHSVYTGMNEERWGLIEKRLSMLIASEANR